MYLFTRGTRLAGGNGRQGIEWAVAMTERVNAATSLDVELWAAAYSGAAGTIAWTTFLPDIATLDAASDTLLADDAYVAAANQGATLTLGGVEDSLSRVVYGDPDPSRDLKYAATVQSVCKNGHIADGVELGVELAQRAEKLTGVPTMVVMGTTGLYGAIGWITGYESVQELDAAEAALASDEKWVSLVDKDAAKAYTEDAAASTQGLWRRIV